VSSKKPKFFMCVSCDKVKKIKERVIVACRFTSYKPPDNGGEIIDNDVLGFKDYKIQICKECEGGTK